MKYEFIKLVGKGKGPTSIVLAGVHGNEKCGVETFTRLLPKLKIKRGIVLLGYGNPKAIRINKRYTEANLNRMFKDDDSLSKKNKGSYEYKRAQFLKKYMDQADVLLDIHASSNLKSKKFIICEPNAYKITKHLPFGLIVTGFDKIEPGGTDYYMNKQGKVGICVECGYLGGKSSTKVAIESTLAFLRARNHISGKIKTYKQSRINMYKLYKARTDSFKLAKPFMDFEKISESQLVGTDGTKKIRADKNCAILFARNTNRKGDEAFLLGK